VSTHPGRFLAVLRPPSRSSLTTNPHSAAAQPGPTSRDFLPWRFLDACQLSVPSASFLPASKNLHRGGKTQSEHMSSESPQIADVRRWRRQPSAEHFGVEGVSRKCVLW